MVNSNKIKGRMREKCKSQKDCANLIGIRTSTFNQKLNNNRPFFLHEVETLQRILAIQDVEFSDFFFYPESCTAQQNRKKEDVRNDTNMSNLKL